MPHSRQFAAPSLKPLDGDEIGAARAMDGAQSVKIALQTKRVSPLQMAALAFFFSLLGYFLLTPWVLKHWAMTGDEPHYLLIAQSLLADGDVDLANNYAQRDYADYYFSTPWLDPHVVDSADGVWRPFHEVSFSLLILPAWALGRYAGVLYFLNLIAALVAANVWLLAYETSGNVKAAWLSWLAVTFTMPLFPYAFQVYPEMPAALLIIWAARQIIRPGKLTAWRWFLVGLTLVTLPWLVIRFLPVSILFAGLIIARVWQRRELDKWRWLAWVGGALVALALIAAVNWRLYGQLSPVGASVAGRVGNPLAQWFAPMNHLDSALGWLFDQRMGLLIYAPVYALALLGLGMLWRRDRWAAAVLGAALIAQYLSLGFVKFQVRWGIPPRYLVAILPLAGGALAACWAARRSRALQGLVVLLLAVSLLTSGLVMAEPRRVFADEYEQSGVVRLYSDRLRADLGQLLPMFMPSTRYKDKGWDDQQDSGAHPHLFPQFKALASPAGTLALDPGAASGWATRADGRDGVLLAGPKVSLPAGAYELTYRLKLGRAIPDERAVGQITVRAGQETLAGSDLVARDLKTGEYQDIKLWFALTERQEAYAELGTPAGSELWADEVVLKPLGTWPARLKGVLWLAALLAFSAYGYRRWGALSADESETAPGAVAPLAVTYRVMTLLAALAALALFCCFWYSFIWARDYEAEGWATQTGRAVDDAAASGGRTMAGKVGADQPGWLSYGPYQVFASGSYELDFWIKRGEAAGKGSDSASVIAFAEVTDVSGGPIYGRREVRLADVPEADGYTRLTLGFTNPKWQKLVFRIYFSGVTDLQFDRARFVRLLH